MSEYRTFTSYGGVSSQIPVWESIEITTFSDLHPVYINGIDDESCQYCHCHSPNDSRGNCGACGAPRG